LARAATARSNDRLVQQDNAFTECDDWGRVQSLAEQIDQLNWGKSLDGWTLRGNPSLSHK